MKDREIVRGDWERRLAALREKPWWGEVFGEKMTGIYQDALAGKLGRGSGVDFGEFHEAELLCRIFGADYVNEWLTQLEDELREEEEEGR